MHTPLPHNFILLQGVFFQKRLSSFPRNSYWLDLFCHAKAKHSNLTFCQELWPDLLGLVQPCSNSETVIVTTKPTLKPLSFFLVLLMLVTKETPFSHGFYFNIIKTFNILYTEQWLFCNIVAFICSSAWVLTAIEFEHLNELI